MGIFNSEGKQSNPVESPQSTNLDQVRNALHLSPEDVETHFHAQLGKEAYDSGYNYYKENSKAFPNAPGVNLGSIALEAKADNKAELVKSIYAQIDQLKPAMEQQMSQSDIRQLMVRRESFATGYGQSALDALDWETAVKSFDVITQGGIIMKPDVIKKLGDAVADKETRLKIYELVSNLVDKRKNANEQNSKPQQAPQITPTPLKVETPVSNVKPPSYLDIPGETNLVPKPPSPTSAVRPLLHNDGEVLIPAPPKAA